MGLIFTTTKKTNYILCDQAQRLAVQYDGQYFSRQEIQNKGMVFDSIFVLGRSGLTLQTEKGTLFFHPSLACLRIQGIKRGQCDHLLQAMQIKPGMQILDCTLGLGTDALVVSCALASNGQVVGLEAEKNLAILVEHGLQHYVFKREDVQVAGRKIQVVHAHHLHYLRNLPNDSFDIVYFDPMFRQPIWKSSQMLSLRDFAYKEALVVESVIQAKRVARKRVIMKEANGSNEFQRLGFMNIYGGKYSSVQYGVWEQHG